MGQEYQVLTITEQLRPTPSGTLERVYRHRITTRLGVTLTVDVPESHFTPDAVSKLLLEKAKNADAILKLG